MMTNLTKVNHDSYGNPRYVCHYLAIADTYLDAIRLAKKVGGKKFHNKYFGGGIVFQSWCLSELESTIESIKQGKTTMNIKRNKDGQQNLVDLRSALTECNRVADVYRVGGNWQISNASGIVESCPWYYTERHAIQHALFGAIEYKEEARYHAAK